MKFYEKPKLMVLSVSANDALCSGCDDTVRNNNELRDFYGLYYGDATLPLTDEELNNLFAANEHCQEKVSNTDYCKFTGADKMFSS